MKPFASTSEIDFIMARFGTFDFDKLEEEFLQPFQKGLIDVYPRQLNVSEARKKLGKSHQYQNEHKFHHFFDKCIQIFDEPFFVYLQNDYVSKSNEKQIIKIQTVEGLKPFLRSIRDENVFYNFFLPQAGVVVIGNFDWTLPVYCLSLKSMNTIENIANQTELFIRSSV